MRTPAFQSGGVTLYDGSCEQMAEIADGSVSLMVTSPPYFIEPGEGLLEPALLQSERDGYQSYEDLLERLADIFSECLRVLKPGGFCAVVVASTRVNKRLYPCLST